MSHTQSPLHHVLQGPQPRASENMSPRQAVPEATAIEVVVRVRPEKKGYDAGDSTVRVTECTGSKKTSLTVWNWRNSLECTDYAFDAVYDRKTQQATIFKKHVARLVPKVIGGMNASVLAYGPTGSGKTWTMQGSPAKPGVIPRTVEEVFSRIKDDTTVKCAVYMSYLEIYNEKVYDLLSFSGKDIAIRENHKREILIPDLSQVAIKSGSDFEVQYKKGCSNRRTGATRLNSTSSRSHAVVVVRVEVRDATGTKTAPVRIGKLNLIDLAGSEDNRRTANQGLRLKESGCINKSLFVLGQVVDALSAAGAGRVPYRDSKLTRLLSDSLGGSAHAVMITCVAPEKEFYQDVMNGLNFATKSKTIVNKPFVNEVVQKPKQRKSLTDATNATQAKTETGGKRSSVGAADGVPAAKRTKPPALAESNVGLDELLSLDDPHPLVKETTDRLMNILNTGGVKSLMKLNGIGEKRASNICEFRDATPGTRFTRMSDLCKISGISKGFARSLLRTNLEQGYISASLST